MTEDLHTGFETSAAHLRRYMSSLGRPEWVSVNHFRKDVVPDFASQVENTSTDRRCWLCPCLQQGLDLVQLEIRYLRLQCVTVQESWAAGLYWPSPTNPTNPRLAVRQAHSTLDLTANQTTSQPKPLLLLFDILDVRFRHRSGYHYHPIPKNIYGTAMANL
jgi:hypothetical protein